MCNLSSQNTAVESSEAVKGDAAKKSNFKDEIISGATKFGKGVDSFMKKVGDEGVSMGKNIFGKIMVRLCGVHRGWGLESLGIRSNNLPPSTAQS